MTLGEGLTISDRLRSAFHGTDADTMQARRVIRVLRKLPVYTDAQIRAHADDSSTTIVATSPEIHQVAGSAGNQDFLFKGMVNSPKAAGNGENGRK